MVRLVSPLLTVMVCVLMVLAAKGMLVLPLPGILESTDLMFLVLELENMGDRGALRLLSVLAS